MSTKLSDHKLLEAKKRYNRINLKMPSVKSSTYSESVFMTFIFALTLVHICSSMSVGLPEGDPAPGRSPGPPLEISPSAPSATSSKTPPYKFESVKVHERDKVDSAEEHLRIDDDLCRFVDDLAERLVTVEPSDSEVSFAVRHSIFETEELVRGIVYEEYDLRPKIISEDGHLIISAGFDKNITLKTTGPNSYVTVNNGRTSVLLSTDDKVKEYRNRNLDYEEEENRLADIYTSIHGQQGILPRLRSLELRHKNDSSSTSSQFQITSILIRVADVQHQVDRINTLLDTNECVSSPCKNGGECIDLYNKYKCQCPKNWEGQNCEVDVDECKHFEGTDIGCQNGATCVNKPGTYECQCLTGWVGLHCTRSSFNCSGAGGDNEICGHGVCLSINSGSGVKCLCDQGWTTDDKHAACVVDVDECKEKKYPCSINPPVECNNLPGTFDCGSCPPGYEGDGFSCRDIDECQINNGGCSTIPNVQCMNTQGSRMCGHCPPGYLGNGTICSWRGTCETNNGGCHPSAQCLDKTGLGAQFIQCICPEGTIGDGVGISGCFVHSSNILPNTQTSQCQLNPCGNHGTCHVMPRGYTCICRDGYRGANCSILREGCTDKPCKNGGICRVDNSTREGYRCECSSHFTGNQCTENVKTCGGFLDSPNGELVYPISNTTTYGHNSKCGWVIHTDPSQVLNVTFTRFNIEHSRDCIYDWLQIHDGRSSGSHMLGRFCGNVAPNGGNIISAHNNLYLWFSSDQSVAHHGFSLHWESIQPTCGGIIDASVHGQITSPGSPGSYPPNRDCYWHFSVNAGKRIQLYFFQLDLETHVNCSFDYLEMFNGGRTSDPLLKKYCDSTLPPPLISPGSNLLIHFHSDGQNTGRGFQIAYAATEGIPGCGGLYTKQVGELTSPTINGNYHDNLYCEYKIQLSPGSLIKINFLYFELENSEPCIFDYLAVYDGGSENSKLVNKYCGKRVPPSFTSTGNELLIVLRTDWAVGEKGFRLKYETICFKMFTEENGVINSPGYPNTYPGHIQCKYKVSVPHGQIVELRFNDFDIESNSFDDNCYFDSLNIYDGDSSKSPKFGTYCGDSTKTPPLILSTHNYIFLEFNTDASLSGTGFSINYTSQHIGCGGKFIDSSGVIAFPKRSSSDMESITYENSKKCSWLLEAPIGFSIQISWITFDIEKTHSCASDRVEVYEIDSDSGENRFIDKYCGDHIPPAMTSASNIVMVNFTSDETLSKTGFTFSYVFFDTSLLCRGIQYHSPNGVLSSPGWPKSYPRHKDCDWTITRPIGQQIFLNVTYFNIEGPSCKHDWLEIRNGGYDQAPIIGKYCGTKIPKTIISLGNAIYLHFHSDYSVQGSGFRIHWHETVTGCGGPLVGSTGSLTSPNYPQYYGKNSECYWRITTSAGSAIEIIFKDLDLEETRKCQYDYLEFYNGRDNSGSDIGRYCSKSYSPRNIQSTSNHLFVKFRSDISVEGKGFSLDYITICNRNISGFNGAIESLDFPNEYPNSLNCTWTITAPRGNKINVTFNHFELQETFNIRLPYSRFNSNWPARRNRWNSLRYLANCSHDFLILRDGININNTVRLCGKKLPNRFRSESNVLEVNFVTDEIYALSGFKLEWAVDGCGGILNYPAGTFLAPSKKGTEIECHWQIVTEPGTSIELSISEIQMRSSKTCNYDSLVVYNGPTKESPVLSSICHSQDNQLVVTSSSNYIFVIFYSSSKASTSSFRANYNSKPSKCGGKFSSYNGEITSPNYPRNYADNMNCFWTIEVEENHLIDISFSDFDISGNRYRCTDALKIYDGIDPSDAGTNVTSYCGSTNPLASTFTSKTNKIVIQLQTDNKTNAKGFKLKYQIACGARITTDGEGILKNNHAINIREDNNCTWTILAKQPNQRVSVTFTHIDILKLDNVTDDCEYDYINVFDGDDIEAPLRGKYCGTKVPSTLVSKGSALTIQLATIYGEILGNFLAHYSVLSTACGGTLTSESGSITSPYYPDTYPFNSDCEWTLATSPGNQVHLHFEKFDLESSEKCNKDYVEIRANNGVGNLLGVHCNDNIPSDSTVGSKLFIKFHSDNEGTARGFILHYSFLHGNEITNSTQGSIASPLYPRMFTVQGEYHWRVTTNLRTLISVSIIKFNIYNVGTYCSSYLAVYDGYDETAPLLMSNCGNEIPDAIQSTSNMLFIKLHIGFLNRGSEFLLQWREITSDAMPSTDDTNKCGSNDAIHIGKGEIYHLTSPGYPLNYGDDIKCEWIFKTDEGNHLSIFFLELDVEETDGCHADYINIFSRNKDSGEWTIISGNLCLSNVTENNNLSATDFMKLTFTTDSFATRKGFSASVISECGGYFKSTSGIIEPTVPHNLLNISTVSNSILNRFIGPSTCEWTVRVRPGHTVKLELEKIKITNKDSNSCDNYVMIRNGGFKDSPMLGKGKYCNKDSVGSSELTTDGNWLYISYVTSHAFGFNDDSFTFRYSEKSIECGFRTTLTAELSFIIISSPNFPDIPPAFSECIWVIMAPVGEILQLDVIDRFDLTYDSICSKEMLEIRDGGTEISNLIGVFCSETPSTQKTSTNMIFVRFITTVDVPKNGFKANISIGTCGGTIRGSKGSLTSPGYPSISNLPPGTSCEWHLIGLPGTILSIHFMDLDLPPSREICKTNLQVLDVLPSNNSLVPLSGTLCQNSSLPATMNTLSHEALIKFQKGPESQLLPFKNKSYRGFSINFNTSMSDCEYHLKETSGFIQSPGYPYSYKIIQFCRWTIEVPEGRRVTLEILDFDSDYTHVTPNSEQLGIYDDNYLRILLKNLPNKDEKSTGLIRSSGNKMFLFYYKRGASSRRGFKAKYTSEEPTICIGSLNQHNGAIHTPITDSKVFHCEWVRNVKSDDDIANKSVVFKFSNLTLSSKSSRQSLMLGFGFSPININGQVLIDTDRIFYQKKLFGNFSGDHLEVRSPIVGVRLIAQRLPETALSFSLSYNLQPCGGVVKLAESETLITLPKNHTGSLDCAWLVILVGGGKVAITTEGDFVNSNCEDEFLKITDQSAYNPIELRKYCKNTNFKDAFKPNFRKILVEYHADSFSNESTIRLKFNLDRSGCGGAMSKYKRSLESPNFPKSYDSNQECIWDIQTEFGFRITLSFISRFNIEETSNCTKDFVQVFDFVNNAYVENSKLCGRNLPAPINSTSNKMRVLFRSDESINGDGFRAMWAPYCGGSFEATDEVQWMHSPTFNSPFAYFTLCTYKIKAKGKFIRLNFSKFELDSEVVAYDKCKYNNVTVKGDYFEEEHVYCGKDLPPSFRFRDSVTIYFSKILWARNFNFNFTYSIDHCREELKQPGIISSPRNIEGTYDDFMNCHWNITAPDDKIIILKFSYFSLEDSHSCSDDYVTVYDGLVTDEEHSLARLCGSLNHTSLLFRSTKNTMSINFVSDFAMGYEGFTAEIVFMLNEKSGCGGNEDIELNKNYPITSPRTPNSSQYQPFLDCQWIMKTSPGQILSVKFDRMHIAPCANTNQTAMSPNNCTCDFLELRDGGHPNAYLLSRHCGHTLPADIKTSANYLYVRFVSDGEIESSGYGATVSATYSSCGKQYFESTQLSQYIIPPRDKNGAISRGLNCIYTINVKPNEILHIFVKKMDIQPPAATDHICYKDKLEFKTGSQNSNFTHGSQFVLQGSHTLNYFDDLFVSASSLTRGQVYSMCGTAKPFNLFITETVSLKVITSASVEASSKIYTGFEMEMSIADTCNMNYTEPQYRITLDDMLFKTCTFIIEAPLNHTISLYFIEARSYSDSESYIEVKDGKTIDSQQLMHTELYSIDSSPNPVFSTGRYMLVEMSRKQSEQMYLRLDMNYVTTDKGPGCGGQFYNYIGMFTSPMYPAPYRKQGVCEWVVETPSGTNLILSFKHFDLGSRRTCRQHYLELVDREGHSVATYCSDDRPADHTSVDNYLRVIYHSSVNAGGPGWKVEFSNVPIKE